MKNNSTYEADSIKVLKGLEAVKKNFVSQYNKDTIVELKKILLKI